jgi:hypothetical protein
VESVGEWLTAGRVSPRWPNWAVAAKTDAEHIWYGFGRQSRPRRVVWHAESSYVVVLLRLLPGQGLNIHI